MKKSKINIKEVLKAIKDGKEAAKLFEERCKLRPEDWERRVTI